MGRFSRYVQKFDFVSHPFHQPVQFINDIGTIVNKRKINILLPIHEDSLIIARFREKLPKNLMIICPSYQSLITAMDKNEILNIAEKAGVNHPKKFAPTNVDEAYHALGKFQFPIIIKTRRGNSGKGVFISYSPNEAKTIYLELINRFSLIPPQLPILQEYIEGDLYGSCFLAKNGNVKACFVEKYLRWKENKFGTSVLREPCDWDLLKVYTEKMVKVLQWTGIGHFDFVVTPDKSQVYLLEMNPRFWGALNLAIINGYNFPLGLVSMYEKGEPDPKAFSPKKNHVRSLWIVGEIIASVVETRRGNWIAPLSSLKRIFFPKTKTLYDDFRCSDPLPLIAEIVYYGTSFFRSNYEINPIDVEMMRYD